MNTNLIAELATEALKNPALAALKPAELRHRILALAELAMLKMLTDGSLDNGKVKALLAIIEKLTILDIKEKDATERRALTETIRLNREEQRQRERDEKQKARQQKAAEPTPPTAKPPTPPNRKSENPPAKPVTATDNFSPANSPVPPQSQRSLEPATA